VNVNQAQSHAHANSGAVWITLIAGPWMFGLVGPILQETPIFRDNESFPHAKETIVMNANIEYPSKTGEMPHPVCNTLPFS
jgi:hypothetical protein